MLEREVLRLRDSERSALHKVDNLQKQVDELLRILVRSNTPPISATSDEAQEGQGDNHQNHETNKTHHHRQGSRSTVTTRFEGNRGVFVDVQFPTNTDVSESTELPGLVRHGHQHDQNSKETRLEYHSQYSSPLSNTSDASPNSNGVRLAELHTPSSTSQDEALWPGFQTKPAAPDDALLSDPRRGIEFVLTYVNVEDTANAGQDISSTTKMLTQIFSGSRLETDCMDHLRGKHLDHVHESGHNHNEKDISGHVTTASLSLWQQHTATLSLSANATFQISNAELERLLSSSLNLGLMSPEITPVQIWNRIRWIPLPGGEQALQRLTRELKKNVFCVG